MWNTRLRPPQSFRKHNLTQELDSDTLTIEAVARKFGGGGTQAGDIMRKKIMNEVYKKWHPNLIV